MKKNLFIVFFLFAALVQAQFCFMAPVTYTAAASGLTMCSIRNADLNNNGIPDIVAADNSTNNAITVMLDYTSGVFTSITTYTTPTQSNATDVAVADFDNDSHLDVVTVNNYTNSISVFAGNGTGSLSAPVSFAPLYTCKYAAWGDFNGDSKIDLALLSNTSSNISILFNNSSGVGNFSFTTVATYTTGISSPNAILAVDIDNVNGLDLVVAGNNTTLNVARYLNNGTGSFTYMGSNITAGASPTNILNGDFDGDGFQDLAFTATSPNQMSFLHGTGSGNFATATTYSMGSYNPKAISAGDYDADGNMDIAVTDWGTVNDVYVFQGTGTATFNTPYVQSFSGGTPVSMVSGDYDANGLTDLFVTSNYISVYLFANAKPIMGGLSPICNGSSTTLNASGSGTFVWSTGATTNSITVSPTANTMYSVTETVGTCSATTSFVVIVNQLPPVLASPPSGSICNGVTANLTASGALTYTWNPGGQTTTVIAVTPTITTTYTLAGTDINGCTNTALATVNIIANKDISGMVYDTTTISGVHIINSGYAYLFRKQPPPLAAIVVDSVQITSSGYDFLGIPGGNYLVKIVADTAFWHGSVPTYYSNKPNAYQWDSALVINHAFCTGSNSTGNDVTIIELPAQSGSGTISGVINADASYGGRYGSGNYPTMGAPLKGVDVKLGKNPGGSPAARTTTDNSGAYNFPNVPSGNYSIYADIPNYGMVTILTVTLTSQNTSSTGNDYCVDSLVIYPCAWQNGINNTTIEALHAGLYPNPTAGKLQVHAGKNEWVDMEIVSVTGQRFFTAKVKDGEDLDVSALPAGIYIARFTFSDGRVQQQKLIRQ